MKNKYIVFTCLSLVLALGYLIYQKSMKPLFPYSISSAGTQSKESPPAAQNLQVTPLPRPADVETGTHSQTLPSQKQGPTKSAEKIIAEKSQKAELERFRKIGAEHSKKIYQQMIQDEIKSLKSSIVNDRALLKKIEESGTGIEEYKFIQSNLSKRKARLDYLLKNPERP